MTFCRRYGTADRAESHQGFELISVACRPEMLESTSCSRSLIAESGREQEKRMSKIKGRCACGAVSYSLTDSPKFSYLCQCHQCQRATGSGHAALFMVRADTLDIAGSLKFYDQLADSSNTMSRGFCSECGTPMMLRSSGYPELRFLTAGSLDASDNFQPTQVLWHSAGQRWDTIDAELKFNENGV